LDNPVVTITYYTDPYCTWCWGSEPILRHVLESYGDQVAIVYKMGGLVEDMSNFHDAANQISTKEQVAPHWREASERHGMPVDESIFLDPENDFTSTWPANIAFKAAELQSLELAGKYLRRLREAAASEHRFIHKLDVQAELAGEVGLDVAAFEAAIASGEAEKAFRRDLEEARSKGISGFPTFILGNRTGGALAFYGYRTYDEFARAIDQLAPEPLKKLAPESIEKFVAKYGRVATQEVAEVFGLSRANAKTKLEQLTAAGILRRLPRGNGELWEA